MDFRKLFCDEKQTVFATCILCSFTIYKNESFGNVLFEAMQFGIPVVASDWRAVKGIVKDGKTGYLVPVKNPVALAKKIECLIIDSERRKQMGKAAREEFLARYTVQKFRENMEHVLSDL